VPVLPLYAWLVGEGWSRRRDVHGARSLVLVTRGALLLALLVPTATFALQLAPWWESGDARARSRPLVERVSSARSVALVDVGWLVWASDVDVIDLGGLTDPTLARAPGGHLDKRVDVAYLAARDPEVILLHAEAPPELDADGNLVRLAAFPVERFVAAHPWTRQHYRVREVIEYRPGYSYVWLERR
jgi:hypothetical protein